MGLSNEERYIKAVYTLTGLLEQLDTRVYTTWDSKRSSGSDDRYIAPVRESASQLLGMLIQKLDTNGLYWIIGESDGGLRGLTCEFFRAQDGEDYFNMLLDEDRDLGGRDMALHTFAGRLGFNRHSGMEQLSQWWELWAYIPALLYPVNRYKDDAFDNEFKLELNRLVSHMLQLKRRLTAHRNLRQAEKVLLLKYSLFADCSYEKDLDVDDKLEHLRNMTQEELQEIIEKRDSEKYRRMRSSDNKKPESVDPVYGKGVVSPREKVSTLMEEFGCKRSIAIQSLWRAMDHDLDEAREFVPYFMQKDLRKNPKVCKAYGCKKKLDPRNKSGYCKEHYLKVRRSRRKR